MVLIERGEGGHQQEEVGSGCKESARERENNDREREKESEGSKEKLKLTPAPPPLPPSPHLGVVFWPSSFILAWCRWFVEGIKYP